MTAKLCPKCGKPLDRILTENEGLFWAHFDFYSSLTQGCTYSKPENAPRCPKRKERAK